MKRDYSIDLLKIACMIWIVGFWHLSNYGQVFSPRFPLSCEITHASMGVFMFFSGFFLKKYIINTYNDFLFFYKKRLSRFYFLYLLSIITFYIGGLFTVKPWFKSSEQLILTIFGLSSFRSPHVGTLWFMSMLMFFYLLTPFILYGKTYYKKITYAFVLFFLIILYKALWYSQLDSRIISLYVLYFSGLLIPNHLIYKIKDNWIYGIFGFVFFILFSIFKTYENSILIITYRTIYCLSFLVFSIKLFRCIYIYINKKTITWFSYILLTIYLFHRQVYQSLELAFNMMGIEIKLWTLYGIFFPTAVFVSYIIQLSYDYILTRYPIIFSQKNE